MVSLGNGGANYNTSDANLKKKLAENQLKISSSPDHVQSETARALQVIRDREKAGLDTADQQKYLTTNLGYKAPATTPSPSSGVTNPVSSMQQPSVNSNTSQSNEMMDAMKAYALKTSTPFSYDADSDPAYQAALQRARSNINDGNSSAQAEMNRRGILNSTITSDRMGEIASNEMGRVETEALPQLMQQAYQRYQNEQAQAQQQFANQGSLASMYQSEDQRSFGNKVTEAELTGNYLPEGAQDAINNILNLKQQAEAQGITAAERAKLSAQADGYRAKLLSMGVDASQYGSAVNYNTAQSNNAGIRTLAGQTLDANKQAQAFNQSQQTWENNFATEQQAYKAARDAISDKQWQAQFDQGVNQFGLNYALNQLQEGNQQSYREAQIALSQDDNDRQWAITDYDMSNPKGTNTGGLTANQILDSMKSLYTDPIYTTDQFGNKTKSGEKLTADAAKREQMFLNVVDADKSDAETKQILSALGLSKKEIETFTKNNKNSGN